MTIFLAFTLPTMTTPREKLLKRDAYPKKPIRVNPDLDKLEGVVLSSKHQEASAFFQEDANRVASAPSNPK